MITASDGCVLALHTLRPGRADLEPLVFLHALAMDARMWQGVADRLGTEATLYALDCRGHGASGKPAGPYTTARFANDLAQVLDSLGAARAHVVGCSMGGTVALAFAGLYPQRVASLSVIDTTAWYGDDAPGAWEGRAQRALREGLASLIPFQAERWFSPGFAESSPEVLAGAVEVFLRNDVNAYAESCRMLGRADERERISRYTGPAIVVVGESDYATPLAMSQDIMGRLPGAELAVLDGLRHYTPMEAPGRVARRIASVLARASSALQ
ncbi:alpha/beta fold hydrolase [Polaromonas sp. YR568]|uniref:alpha/beta fold hydrolase n=1 Tax=Polaromonas sp. YR568 TaxID=1855301 RepID=UPI00398BE391